jgi:hypothetical protein
MQILLNELSLSAQFTSVDNFVQQGVLNLLRVLSELKDEDEILKKYNFYSYHVTSTHSVHDVLTGSVSRTFDELRKFKIHLSKVLDKPYWEEDQRHNNQSNYLFGTNSVVGSSIAEACERDRVIISFTHLNFQTASIIVNKNGGNITLDNLFDDGHYTTLLHTKGLLTVFSLKNRTQFIRTNLVRQGKAVYQELVNGNYWYLDNLHKNHFEVFNANQDHLGIADLNGSLDTSKSVNGRKL